MCNQTRRRQSAVIAVALSFCALVAAGGARAGTVETRTPFGRIEMVEEVRTRDPGEPPIMHVATEWTKLHLRWRSRDGVVSVDIVDDGWMIKAYVDATVGKASCLSSVNYLQYSGVAGESEIEAEVRDLIARLLATRGCALVSREVSADQVRTLADGAEDFAAAEVGLRARARDLFKRPPTRCLAPPPQPPPPRPKKGQPEILMIPEPFESLPCRKAD